MSLICFASAHGSPGVTTTVVAVAGVWPADRGLLLVEADPSGGMLAARLELSDTPGLVSLAAAARRGLDWELVSRHAQQVAAGIAVLVAPPSAQHASAALSDVAGPLVGWCSQQGEVDVLVDCGRLSPDPVALPLLRGADRTLIMARPTVDQLRPAAIRCEALAGAGAPVGLLLVGDSPYGPAEVEATLRVPVAGVLAWDPPTAGVLESRRSGNDVRRSQLVRSAASLVDLLITPPVDEPKVGVPAASGVETGGRVS